MTSGGLAAVSSSAFAALYSAFGKYDVVHIHAEGPAFFTWLPKMFGKRVVVAAKVNCSREYIVQIENGTKVPSLSVLVEIANTLSVSADELLLDCLEHSSSSANSEFHRLLLDCNETEQTVIIRMAKELKAALVSLGI